MVKIRKIDYWAKGEKYYVKLTDGNDFSIRKATFQAMNLQVGQPMTIDELKEFENFVWKKVYGPNSWEKEKVRIEKVKALVENINSNVEVEIVGFGADSTETFLFHPDESGSPDLRIKNQFNHTRAFIEVTGTEKMQGDTGYWVRKDKLTYAQNHPDKNIWIVLHYQFPEERFVYIKPQLGVKYQTQEVSIREINENYVIFDDNDIEVKTSLEFTNDVQNW